MKFVTPLGTFYFQDSISYDVMDKETKKVHRVVEPTPLSHMKIIRDAVVNQILNPKGRVLRSTKDIYKFAKAINGPASVASFRFIPAPGVWIKQGINQTMGRQHRNVKRVA